MDMNLQITNSSSMELKKKVNKKIFIKTFGCQMNEYDSNRIFDIVKKIENCPLDVGFRCKI